MSTNFYWQPPKDHALYPFRQIHIGMTAGGWEFMFQGYRFEGAPDEEVTVGPGLSVCMNLEALSFNVTSWEAWKALLQEGGEVVDEYGSVWPLAQFLTLVEETFAPGQLWNNRPLLNHYRELCDNPAHAYRFDNEKEPQDWQDPQGYSFTLTNFS